jgi:hypothetical protein
MRHPNARIARREALALRREFARRGAAVAQYLGKGTGFEDDVLAVSCSANDVVIWIQASKECVFSSKYPKYT